MRPAKLAPVVAALRGVLLLFVCSSLAGAQNQIWIRQVGTGDGDYVRGAAPNGSGGVYVCGSTQGSLGAPNAGSYDAWLAQYDGAGNQVWSLQLGTSGVDEAVAAASDGMGGVFVCGLTFGGNLGGPSAGYYDAWIAHYDGASNQSWIRQLGTSDHDAATAAASDGAGGVFVAGYTGGSLGGANAGERDAWLAHYDAAGNQLWLRQMGTSLIEILYAAAQDGVDGVYLCGNRRPVGGVGSVWVAHYDGAGNETWQRGLGTALSDYAQAVAPDGSGGVFVSGGTRGSLGGPNAGSYDAWLARYDSAGNQAWIRQLGTSQDDGAYSLAQDGTGGVYVSGRTRGALGAPSAGDYDIWLAHYDAAGSQIWIRQMGTSQSDYAFAAAPDGGGSVYIGGFTNGSLAGPNAGNEDVWLARYGPSGPVSYCSPTVPNSTGQPGRVNVDGSLVASDNDFTLVASQLSQNSFGFFITSQTQGFVAGAGGSQGNLCLSGQIGRFVGAGQILDSGAAGTFSLMLDLNAMPTPLFTVAVQPGEVWNFQAWHRDANPTLTSNFTTAVSVVFQ